MARLREAIGGEVLPARMASSAALFQSVTTSAFARVPMLDVRFITPTQAVKSKVLKKAFIGGLLSTKSGSVVRYRRHWRQAYSARFSPANLNESLLGW